MIVKEWCPECGETFEFEYTKDTYVCKCTKCGEFQLCCDNCQWSGKCDTCPGAKELSLIGELVSYLDSKGRLDEIDNLIELIIKKKGKNEKEEGKEREGSEAITAGDLEFC